MQFLVTRRWQQVALGSLVVASSACLVLVLTRVFGGSTHTGHDRARAQLRGLASKIELFREHTGHFPETLDALAAGAHDGPYSGPRELLDPWGERFYYRPDMESGTFRLFTLGADRRPGGDEEARDLDADDAAGPATD